MTSIHAPRNLLVTGGTGYLGGAFVQWLEKSAQSADAPRLTVKVLVAPGSYAYWHARWPGWMIPVEGRLPDLGKEFSFDEPAVLVHLAVRQCDQNLKQLNRVNVLGTRCLLTGARNVAAVIYASSLTVLGSSAANATEATPPAPITRLARSLADAERQVLDWGKSQRAWALCLRPGLVLDAADERHLPGLYQLWSERRRIGKGAQQFSVISLDDYCAVLWRLIECVYADNRPQQTPLHLAYREPVSFFSLFNLLHLFSEGRRLSTSEFGAFREVPVNPVVLGLLRRLPVPFVRRLLNQFEWALHDRHADVSRLGALIGTQITDRPVRDALETVFSAWFARRFPDSADQRR